MSQAARPSARPCVAITTYARPDGLATLLGDLEREQPAGGVDLLVFDDATPHFDPALTARITGLGGRLIRARENHGKTRWWQWWNTILRELRAIDAPAYYLLQDDLRLCRSFFAQADALWASIDDPRKASLYLHVTPERGQLGVSCWTPVRSTDAGSTVHSGWVDCAAFRCGRELFDAVDWSLHPIPERRWATDPAVSSGVGQQLSVRAHAAGLRMYRAKTSLALHDGAVSVMNAEARERWPMETVAYADGDAAAGQLMRARPHVFASVASIPGRAAHLRQVVEALQPQVDELAVYLNGYDRVPRWLAASGADVATSQEHGLRGDAGKFFWAGRGHGYRLVCDDDLAYPPDYVERLVAGIERHGRRAVVGFHGAVLHDRVTDYHRSRRVLHFSRALRGDVAVHVLGTGAAGFHSAALAVGPSDFPVPDMADVWLARLGQQARVPFVCLAREHAWLTDLPGSQHDSIYLRARARPIGTGPETEVVRGLGRWTLHRPPTLPVAAPGDRAGGRAARAAGSRRVALPGAPAGRTAPLAEAAAVRPARPTPLVRLRAAGRGGPATLVMPSGDHITECIRSTGDFYERDLLEAIRACGAAGAFIDVGAHYGNHTAYFALECGAQHVVAIEPSSDAVRGLRETVAANRIGATVDVRHAAAHPRWRRVRVEEVSGRVPGRAATNSGQRRIVAAEPATAGQVAAAPLDELASGAGPVGVVKVDTCGSSAETLRSGLRMLRRDRPLIAAEASTTTERIALRALLEPLGYRERGPYCFTPTWIWEPRPAGSPPPSAAGSP